MKLVADNIRITRRDIREALADRNAEPVKALARRCVSHRADAIDINAGPLKKSPKADMAFLVEAVASVTALPLLVDTVNPVAMEAALAKTDNPVILNGVSLEPAKLAGILPLAKAYDVDVVGFLLYEDSRVPKTAAERLELALTLVDRITAAGITAQRLIIDPVVPPLSWDDGLYRARELVETIRMLPDLLGFPVRTIAGLSNLTTGTGNPQKKALVEAAFLPMLSAAGLTHIMLDIFRPLPVNIAKTCGILTREDIFSWEQVPEYRRTV